MVDARDMLMQLSLVDFFEALVSLMRVTESSAWKIETLRGLIREASNSDPSLKPALLTLPERTVPEEADELKAWLQELIPGEAVRSPGPLAVRCSDEPSGNLGQATDLVTVTA